MLLEPGWQSSCPRLLHARIIGVHHHGWLSILTLHYVLLNPFFSRFMFEGKSLNSLSKKHALEVETGSSWGQGTVLAEATEGLWVWFGIVFAATS